MTYRTDSSSAYSRANNDGSSSSYQRATSDGSTNSTNYYQDRVQNGRDYRNQGTELSTQGALDAWAPRRAVAPNDYRDPETFVNPYTDLSAANQINKTRGFYAARDTFLRSIQEADGIDVTSIREDRRSNMQSLARIDSRSAQISRSNGSLEELQNLDQQRDQILNNTRELRDLYYAPANTRISMGLACIKTGNPLEMAEGQRLIEEAKRKRPEIANDPRLEQMVDKAYQVGYRAHNLEGNSRPTYREFQPTRSNDGIPTYQQTRQNDGTPTYQQTRQNDGAPTYQQTRQNNGTPEYQQTRQNNGTPEYQTRTDSNLPRLVRPENNVPQPAPWQPRSIPAPVPALEPRRLPQPQYDVQINRPAPPNLEPPARVHAEVPAPAVVPNDRNGALRPTEALIQNSQTRISDAEALNWLHNRYKHLSVENMTENARQAQKAYDDTPTSWNPFEASKDARGNLARGEKTVEYFKGFRADLENLFETAKQPHSHDSDMARQALITIIKTSAENMADEALNREIAQESCEQVKELCRAKANGRTEMVDAVRIGLTESAHLPAGAKNYLMDGLELLATDQPPVIRMETAGRIALLALKHEVDNTPRLGAPDRRGETREECNQRQVRLIELIDKFGFKTALTDLQDIVKSHPSDDVRKAAALAIAKLEARKA